MRAAAFAVGLLIVAAPLQAQIMTGAPPAGSRSLPTLPLDTNVGTNRPTFRATVTRVEVSAIVVDGDGRPVHDLRAEDFEVLDGGRKQKLLSFEAFRRDASAIALDALPAEEAAGAATFTNAWTSQSRMFALVIDDLHIDARHAERARKAARSFVDALAPSDLLFVSLTSSPSLSTVAFTRDRRRARALIDGFSGMRLVDQAVEIRQQGAFGRLPPGLAGSEQQRSMRLVDAYATIERVATAARAVTGRRKSLVFVSEGASQGAGQVASTALTADATSAMTNAVAAATAADVAVYPLNPAGLDLPTDRMIEGFTRQVEESGRDVAHEDLSALVSQFLQAKNQLRDLASLTGGASLADHNDVSRAVARVLSDASDVYLLSYEPDKALKGAKARSLEIRVKRPGVRVRARRGYLAPPATPDATTDGSLSPELRELLTGIVATDGLPLFVQAVPVAREGSRVRFALVVEAAGAPLVANLVDGQLPLHQAVVAIDDKGRMGKITQRQAVLKIGADASRVVAEQGLRTIWSIDLPPGEHQVRVATVQPATGLRGSMYLDLAVQDAHPVDPASLTGLLQFPKPTAFVDPAVQSLLAPGQ